MIAAILLVAQVSTTLPGTVVDLSPEPGQHLIYCTEEGEVGRLDASGAATVLAGAGSFPTALRALAPAADGSISVIDFLGDLYSVPQWGGAPTLLRKDKYLITKPTDLLVDSDGVHLIACRTVSAATRCIAQVSADGLLNSYLHVADQPLALAADPFGGVLYSDANGFVQQLTEVGDAPFSSPQFTAFGFSVLGLDGDLALESSGDVWIAAGVQLLRVDRATGTASTMHVAAGNLHSVAIAAGSAGGQSVWFTEGAQPSGLIELPIAASPAALTPPSFGPVPGTGILRTNLNLLAIDLEALPDGDLVVSGFSFGADPYPVRRVSLPSFALSTIAGAADGFDDRVAGVAVEAAGSLLAVQQDGVLRRIVEGSPATVETVYSDPTNIVGRAKDLVLGTDGTAWIADFPFLAGSGVRTVHPDGSASSLANVNGALAVAADPTSAQLLTAEWNSTGFDGALQRIDPATGAQTPVPGFSSINWANDGDWGDGDACVDALGRIYTVADDEFCVRRWDPATGLLTRVSAGYQDQRLAGLAIAPSVDPASATGWSLYVASRIRLWEVPGVPPPLAERLDHEAPPIGAPAGFVAREFGEPTALLGEPATGDLLIATDAGWILRLTPGSENPATPVIGPGSGLPGHLVGLALDGQGDVLAAGDGGTVALVQPGLGYATSTLFTDPFGALGDVLDIAIDGNGDVLLLADLDPADRSNEVHRITVGTAVHIADTARGLALDRDPLSGDLFVAERGRPGEGGELLRVETQVAPERSGHWLNPAGYRSLQYGEQGGGLAIDGDGHFYLASGADGRVRRVDRASGVELLVAGQCQAPRDLAVATGRAGLAGALGASLFVLDGSAVFEVGIDGPVAQPGAIPPGMPSEPLTTLARRAPSAANTVWLESAADAGRLYWILPSVQGKEPAIPLSLGDPSDPRLLPTKLTGLWDAINGATFPNFSSSLDGAGLPVAPIAINAPDAAFLASLGVFLDLTWISIDFASPNYIGTVGNTAQLWLGP